MRNGRPEYSVKNLNRELENNGKDTLIENVIEIIFTKDTRFLSVFNCRTILRNVAERKRKRKTVRDREREKEGGRQITATAFAALTYIRGSCWRAEILRANYTYSDVECGEDS